MEVVGRGGAAVARDVLEDAHWTWMLENWGVGGGLPGQPGAQAMLMGPHDRHPSPVAQVHHWPHLAPCFTDKDGF
jgi:hypothetical protein